VVTGSTGGSSSSSGSSSGGVSVVDAGPFCRDIDVSTFDTSCQADGDCVIVTTGHICTNSCLCGGSTINQVDYMRWVSETQGLGGELCPCPAFGTPRCIQHTCTVCAPWMPAPGCGDGG
jgi:hypothetical protein